MKTIALLGATGKSGKKVLEKLLENNYSIKALVRNPQKLDIRHKNLTIVVGDALDQQDVLATINGCDSVISTIGHVSGSPARLQTIATKNIVYAMEKCGITRLISLSGAGLPDSRDTPAIIDRLITIALKLFAKERLQDSIEHQQVLQNSNLEWTIVRAPLLTNSQSTGKYAVGYVGKINGFKLTREDLAIFIVSIVDTKKYIREMPAICNK